jgi:hypothetical protein
VANGAVKKVNGIAPGTDGNVVVDIPTGVHVGNDAPTDADTSVWIDPDDATPVIDTTIFVQKSSIISSTEDLTAGTSSLATGSIYLMYE